MFPRIIRPYRFEWVNVADLKWNIDFVNRSFGSKFEVKTELVSYTQAGPENEKNYLTSYHIYAWDLITNSLDYEFYLIKMEPI